MCRCTLSISEGWNFTAGISAHLRALLRDYLKKHETIPAYKMIYAYK